MSSQVSSFSYGSDLAPVKMHVDASPEGVAQSLDAMGQPVLQVSSFGTKGRHLSSARRAAAQQSRERINSLAGASLEKMQAVEASLSMINERGRDASGRIAQQMQNFSWNLQSGPGANAGQSERQKLMDLRGKLHEASMSQRFVTAAGQPSAKYVSVVHPGSEFLSSRAKPEADSSKQQLHFPSQCQLADCLKREYGTTPQVIPIIDAVASRLANVTCSRENVHDMIKDALKAIPQTNTLSLDEIEIHVRSGGLASAALRCTITTPAPAPRLTLRDWANMMAATPF